MLPGAVWLFLPGHMVWVHVHVPLTLGPGKARRSDLSGREGRQTPVCLTRQFASRHTVSYCFLVPWVQRQTKQDRQVVQRLRNYSKDKVKAYQFSCKYGMYNLCLEAV